jgi:hypothetical protein
MTFSAMFLREVKRGERSSGMLNKALLAGCSKTLRYKAPEIPRNETYIPVRCSDEG